MPCAIMPSEIKAMTRHAGGGDRPWTPALQAQAVRKGEVEVDDMAAARERAAQSVQPVDPYYEAGSVARREPEESLVSEDAFKTDYLAPFLPRAPPKVLSAAQARHARDACLWVRRVGHAAHVQAAGQARDSVAHEGLRGRRLRRLPARITGWQERWRVLCRISRSAWWTAAASCRAAATARLLSSRNCW